MAADDQPLSVSETCRFCSPPRAKSPTVESCTALVLQFEVEETQDAHGLTDLLQPLLDPREDTTSDEPVDSSQSAKSLGKRAYLPMEVTSFVAGTGEGQTGDGGATLEVPSQLPFTSGVPAVGTVKGLLHLFKESAPSSLSEAPSEKVCIYGIPTSLVCADLIQFLAPVCHTLHCLQIVREMAPNHYLALLKFKDKPSTLEFYTAFNGKKYSSFEDYVCHVVFVTHVDIKHKTGEAALPVAGLTELPNWPVCLERMDESVSSVLTILCNVLTILCNHSFHLDCLTKWEDNTCPICRCYQSPVMSDSHTCTQCDSREDLWICLICGHVGCGRYVGGHAHNHFIETNHTYSMQLGNDRVWDYIGDNYVHRLVQNKSDGKLVAVEGPGTVQGVGYEEKLDSLQLEYTYLLTSQLESQRVYFEEKLTRVETAANEQIELAECRCKSAVSKAEKLEVCVSDLEREKRALEKKCAALQSKVDNESESLKEEMELNKALTANQDKWKKHCSVLEEKLEENVTKKEKEIQELQAQVGDLMFYLDTQSKVASTADGMKQDIQEGHVVVTQSAPTSRKPKKRHR